MSVSPFKRIGPHTSPAITVQLPCDRCGSKEHPVVSIYAAHELHAQYGDTGFWPARSFRLCGDCLRGALETLELSK